jgi:hemerythrin
MVNDGPGLVMRLRQEATRIASQHKRLDELYAEVRSAVDNRATDQAFLAFGQLRGALHAHFEMEDGVYFPAVHGLHPEHTAVLETLSNEHVVFRQKLEKIHDKLYAQAFEATRELLDELVRQLLDHEKQEDALLSDFKQP